MCSASPHSTLPLHPDAIIST